MYQKSKFSARVFCMDILEHHPYKPFLPSHTKRIIIGNFPIGKFSNPKRSHERKESEMDFYYGGSANRLWHLIGTCFNEDLTSKEKITKFLRKNEIGMADIILSCRRIKGSALDSALYDKTYNIQIRDILRKRKIEELIFTSKHVYQEFRKYIGLFPDIKHTVLISPSPNAVRGLVKNQEFFGLKEKRSFS